MLETSQALAQVEPGVHARILTLSESLLDESPGGRARVYQGLRSNHGQAIHRPGRAMVRGGRDPPAAEPRRWTGPTSRSSRPHSESILEALSSGIELDRIKTIMEMYCRGLAGR